MQKIKLSLPEPCHENWNNMTPGTQGRFCHSCAKSVIDFSSMTDAEVLNYFSRVKDDNICGRVYPDQLERTIQTQASKKIWWYWNYIIAFFFLFAKSNNTKAQGEVKTCNTSKPDSTKKNSPGTKTIKPVRNDIPVRLGKISMAHKPLPAEALHVIKTAAIRSNMQISGTIIDENGKSIPGASIIVLPFGTGLSSNDDGTFSVALDPLKNNLKISAIGYEEKIIDKFDTLQPKIMLKQQAMKMGEVVVTGFEIRSEKLIAGGISVARRISVIDTIKNFISIPNPAIKIYPNPAQAGSMVNVELRLKPGTYNLQVFDAAGKIITQKQINAATGKFKEQLKIEKAWTGGNYFIRVFDGKKMVEGVGFLVQ